MQTGFLSHSLVTGPVAPSLSLGQGSLPLPPPPPLHPVALCPSPTHVPNFTTQSITAQTSGSSHSDPSFPSPHFNHSLTFHGAPIQLDPVLPPSPATASSWHGQPLLRAQTDKSSSKVHPLCVTDIPSHHGEPRVQ